MTKKVFWTPHVGPQLEVLKRTEYEILFGGSRGGGKTDAGLAWLIRWNSIPHYRALVIRRNSDDLRDWVDRAQIFYGTCGGRVVGNPPEIRFPSGAKIRTGHLKDDNAYTKYMGHEYHKMLIEELTQIDSELNYLKLIASCRSTDPKLKPQIFSTTNPGGLGHCLASGDVLTDSGWKKIQDVSVGDMVMSQDEAGDSLYQEVKQKMEYDIDDYLLSFNSITHSITATKEHKIARVTETKNKDGRIFHAPSLIKFKDIPKVTRTIHAPKSNHGGVDIDFIYIKAAETARLNQPETVSGDDYCELMGWFLSEGCTLGRDKGFSIAQSKVDNRKIIKNLLDRIGFDYRESKDGFTIHSRAWYEYLSPFGKCRDIFVPDNIKGATVRQIKLFWKAAMLGDGHGKTYYTISKRMSEDMQELGLKMGFDTRLKSRQRKNRKGLSYEIVFKNNRLGWLERSNVVEKRYKGKVYCIGVPNHMFFVRQNGTVFLSGNSWVRERFNIPGSPKVPVHVEDEITKRKRIFIPARVDDNPTLMENDPDYIHFLESLPENTRKAWLLGSWDVWEGQFFPEFSEDVHVVEPFPIPETWRKYRSTDFGRTAPFATICAAVDYDGNVWIYREYYKAGLDADVNASNVAIECSSDPINPETGNRYELDIVDRQVFAQQGQDMTIAEILEKNGMPNLVPAGGKQLGGRVARWTIFHEYLRHMTVAGKTIEEPKLKIFSTCPNTIRTIPMMIHDDKKPEDIVTTGVEDHCFVAGTKVSTKRGDINIEDVVVGDKVSTPLGWSKVYRSRCTGTKRVYDYGAFTCTSDHKILTSNGLVEVDTITDDDMILTWERRKPYTLMRYLIAGIQSPRKQLTDFIFDALVIKSLEARRDFYTEKYGNTITAKFLTAMWCIILIVILVITTSLILSVSVLRSMLKGILIGVIGMVEKVISKKSDRLQRNGTHQKKEEHGMSNMEKKHGKRKRSLNLIVLNVARNLKHTLQTEKGLVRPNTVIKTAVQKRFVGEEKVYNIAVKNGCYFANGVLVSNCVDAIAYLLATLHELKSKAPMTSLEKKMKSLREGKSIYANPNNLYGMDNFS